MRNELFTVTENERIAKSVYRMRLEGETCGIAPGQFVNIKLSGRFLRRPISVCDIENGVLTLIYKAVGGGTVDMSLLPNGTILDVLTGLGNGYDLAASGERPLLLGGGVGVPPLYLLAKRLIEQGEKPVAVLGFNTAEEAFYADEFSGLGCEVAIATVDGSLGVHGFVTDAAKAVCGDCTYYYACGPEPMLRAVYHALDINGELSFERRMGCGFGACMGCTCSTISGAKRICREGPVLKKEEILWED